MHREPFKLLTGTRRDSSRGIVLLALGHAQYGRMAANLAASIRLVDKTVPIHLVHSGGSVAALPEAYKGLFSSMFVCPEEFYTKGGKTVYLKAKTCIYELSPFGETILLDVDLVWFSDRSGSKSPARLFEFLKDVDFTMQNRGFADLSTEKLNEKYCLWCNIKEVKEKYGATGRFYLLASEFLYFKRSKANKKYFDTVREIFEHPKIKGKTFGGDLPDELAFDIAGALLKHYPHQDNYVNVYWFQTEPRMEMNKIVAAYYGYSIGGNSAPEHVKTNYNNITKFAARALGLPGSFPYVAKRQYLPERKNV